MSRNVTAREMERATGKTTVNMLKLLARVIENQGERVYLDFVEDLYCTPHYEFLYGPFMRSNRCHEQNCGRVIKDMADRLGLDGIHLGRDHHSKNRVFLTCDKRGFQRVVIKKDTSMIMDLSNNTFKLD